MALKALTQCQSHIRNRAIIDGVTKECGMTLSRFRTDEHLELYYDLKQGRHDVGFVAKGWDDPGFRIGDIVEVPKWQIADMREHMYAILTFCATQGVAVTIEENDETIELQMNSVISLEGLNREVFKQALHHLELCVEKAHELIG
ncbi:MAG: hypothetical protein CAF45_016660 [Nitrospira sp. CG24E]|nr:MAG: hypothetical protein CAF45_016660 [Nitrospira sp. CG24E]